MDRLNDLSEVRNAEYQVVIIVDAENGRLNPLTQNLPRCLLPIANRKLLSYQLDLLAISGITEVFIVAPQDYMAPLRQFRSENIKENMNIDLVFVEEMSGTVDGLRAVAERIRGEFICLTADFISQINITHLVNKHRLHVSDITMLLASIPFEEPIIKKGGSRIPIIDEEDKEIMGIDIRDGRVLMRMATLDLEEDLLPIQKSIMHKCEHFSLRNNIVDIGAYVMSKWILEYVKSKKRFSCIRTDLIPYLISRQYQSKEYLYKHIPALAHRKRYLDCLEPWIIESKAGTKATDLVSILSKTLLKREVDHSSSSSSSSNHGIDDHSTDDRSSFTSRKEDLLRCFGLLWEPTSTGTPIIISRIVNIKTYVNLNRDIPLVPYNSSIPWPTIDSYHKKESSVIDRSCELSDKVTVQQCTLGPGTKIGIKSKLNNCIVMNGVTIGENCIIQNSVICPNVIIENDCNLNSCEIGFGVKISAGSNIKNEQLTNDDDDDGGGGGVSDSL